MAKDGPLDDLTDSLDDKVGGIPVWVIGLGLGLLIGVIWYFYQSRSASGPTARVFDPESADAANPADQEPQNSDYGLPNGPIGDWLSENPGSSAYPVSPNSLPITNAQWARYVTDTFLSKGDDPTIVTNAISKYLKGLTLTPAEIAVINRALALMSPPEGVLPIVNTPASTAVVAPTGIKQTSSSLTSISATWTDVAGARGYRIYINDSYRMESIRPKVTVAFLRRNTSYKLGVEAVSKDTGKAGPRASATVRTKK
jgi:hypothetical protein